MDTQETINKLVDDIIAGNNSEAKDGFESALIGISTSEPKVAIYDFWKALDCVVKEAEELNFDEALAWLEEFSKEKIENAEVLTPIFVKTL